MQPPVSAGTVLQNRYHLLRVLGQGGFGRTYLAEDRGRFDELCAIKEYIPPQTGAYALEKSKELFQREASILYQIQHPQVPQFRAVFEENGRFFLIQDYVDGQTYSELLAQRTSMGYSFSSQEVLDLFRQLLPVLAHIHDRGIIHRDISPDNIILRDRDQAPVLIDFGVVKEIITHFKPTPPGQRTTVGKLGYAPNEQVQMGEAYPSSDLYSLAVTGMVLLTGKQPSQLTDTAGQWLWRRYATATDPLLLNVIDRLLQPKPGDRYQSARDVLLALGVVLPETGASALKQTSLPDPFPNPVISNPVLPNPELLPRDDRPSVLADPISNTIIRPRPSAHATPYSTTSPRSSFFDDPLAVIAAGISIIALAGIGSWAIVRALLVPQPEITPSPSSSLIVETGSPSAFSSPRPLPSPTLSPSKPIAYQQPIELIPNQPQRFERRLNQHEIQTYTFSGKTGQQLSAYIAGEGVLMTIAGADQQPIQERANRVSVWEGTLPVDGEYSVILKPVEGLRESSYSLELTLQNPTPTSTNPSTLELLEQSPPQYEQENISLPPSNRPTTLTGEIRPTAFKRYWFSLEAGQTLEAEVIAGNVRMSIFAANGVEVPDLIDIKRFSMVVPRTDLYFIDVTTQSPSVFGITLQVTEPQATPAIPISTAPPLPPPTAPSTPVPQSPQPTVTIVPAITPSPENTPQG
jgi:serine/threonine-protein kinase